MHMHACSTGGSVMVQRVVPGLRSGGEHKVVMLKVASHVDLCLCGMLYSSEFPHMCIGTTEAPLDSLFGCQDSMFLHNQFWTITSFLRWKELPPSEVLEACHRARIRASSQEVICQSWAHLPSAITSLEAADAHVDFLNNAYYVTLITNSSQVPLLG